jgi:hypothetical protein
MTKTPLCDFVFLFVMSKFETHELSFQKAVSRARHH